MANNCIQTPIFQLIWVKNCSILYSIVQNLFISFIYTITVVVAFLKNMLVVDLFYCMDAKTYAWAVCTDDFSIMKNHKISRWKKSFSWNIHSKHIHKVIFTRSMILMLSFIQNSIVSRFNCYVFCFHPSFNHSISYILTLNCFQFIFLS